jgi:hypothetical protein
MDGRDGMRPARAWAVVGGAVLLAVVAVLVLRTSPRSAVRHPEPGILASPRAAPGVAGGLLPEVVLRGRIRTTPARELRPAVVMLVAPDCRCIGALRRVVAAAAERGLLTYVVQSGDSLDQPESLAAQAGGDVAPYADPTGTLAAAYRLRSDAALVLVRSDGVVTQVVAAVGPALRLDAALRALVVR